MEPLLSLSQNKKEKKIAKAKASDKRINQRLCDIQLKRISAFYV